MFCIWWKYSTVAAPVNILKVALVAVVGGTSSLQAAAESARLQAEIMRQLPGHGLMVEP